MIAGHCVGRGQCPESGFGMGYFYEAPGQLPALTSDDFYGCAQVHVDQNGRGGDYAVFELDRDVTFAEPLELDLRGVSVGDPLLLMGFPSTITFDGTVDAFSGNSGSAVLWADGRAVGILVAGSAGYSYDRAEDCFCVNEVPADEDEGETITDIRAVTSALCATGYSSERLCAGGIEECGDGFCAGDESFDSCPDDCRDGVPAEWTCSQNFYNVGDDCDGDCGAYDPDCDDPDLEIFGCLEGQTCGPSGECEGEPTDEGPGGGGDAPDGWTCPAGFYDVGDDCDCDCGIYAPDCDDPSLSVFGCDGGDMVCSECIEPGTVPDSETPDVGFAGDVPFAGANGSPTDEGGGCATAPARGTAWWLAVGGLALIATRRRGWGAVLRGQDVVSVGLADSPIDSLGYVPRLDSWGSGAR